MKKLHITSDIVLQSDKGTVKIQSTSNELLVHFSDWTAVSSFFEVFGTAAASPFKILRLTKNLEQKVSILVQEKSVLKLSNGGIHKWKFFPVLKLFMTWRRSG